MAGSLRRRPLSSTSQEQNQMLSKGLEQMQKSRKQPQPSKSSSSSSRNPAAESTIAQNRTERLKQAAINSFCSFMVVLLAAQAYKAKTERQRALDHLEAATEVLNEKQKKLKMLVEVETADELAASCVAAIIATSRQERQGLSWMPWSSSRDPKDPDDDEDNTKLLKQELSTVIHGKLSQLIDPTDFVDDDRDREIVRELAKTVVPPNKRQIFTI